MRKTSILVIGALALILIASVGGLIADTWSGTGTGVFQGRHPFQTWSAEVDESTHSLSSGLWQDEYIRPGFFWNDHCIGTTYYGYWGFTTTEGEGTYYLFFDFDNDTCYGQWTATGGGASGYIYGSKE